MATKVQQGRAQSSCFSSCFHFSNIFSKQKKRKKTPHGQIDPRVSPVREESKGRLERHRTICTINWCGFKPMKSGRKQLPVNPEVGGKDAKRAIPSTADRKISGSSKIGVVHDNSGYPHSRPAVAALPTPTASDSTADQSQQQANFRPNRSESHETIAIREIQEVRAAPVPVTCSGDPARTPSEKNSSMQRPIAHDKQKPWKCFLSPDFSRNPVNRGRKKPVYELGPIVGMSIVLVSLTSLLLCGRLCSIFWTSACLCLVPRPRKRETTHGADAKTEGQALLDVDSDEYKKKVIMDGMLKRSHKSNFGL